MWRERAYLRQVGSSGTQLVLSSLLKLWPVRRVGRVKSEPHWRLGRGSATQEVRWNPVCSALCISSEFTLFLYFEMLCVSVYVCADVCRYPWRSEEGVRDLPELDLQWAFSEPLRHLTWMLAMLWDLLKSRKGCIFSASICMHFKASVFQWCPMA